MNIIAAELFLDVHIEHGSNRLKSLICGCHNVCECRNANLVGYDKCAKGTYLNLQITSKGCIT